MNNISTSIFLFVILSLLSFVACNFCLHNLFSAQFARQNPKHQIADLEIARGMLCYFVFIGHSVLAYNQIVLGGEFWPPLQKFKTVNHLAATGIDGFFFITGYLFAVQLSNNKIDKFFLINRGIRLFPALVVTTLAIILVKFFMDGSFNLEGLYLWVTPFYNYTDIHGDLIYGHFWSLRNEWIFYFIVFFVGLTVSLRPNFYALIILAALTIFDITFSMIISGILAYVVLGLDSAQKLMRSKVMIITIIIFYLSFIYLAPLSFLPNPIRHSLRWLSTFSFGLVLVNQQLSSLIHRRLLDILTCTGTAAYSLYLVHGAILFFLLSFSSRYNITATLGFFIWPLIIVPLWLFTGWAIYIIAERPYYIWKFKGR